MGFCFLIVACSTGLHLACITAGLRSAALDTPFASSSTVAAAGWSRGVCKRNAAGLWSARSDLRGNACNSSACFLFSSRARASVPSRVLGCGWRGARCLRFLLACEVPGATVSQPAALSWCTSRNVLFLERWIHVVVCVCTFVFHRV